MKEIAYSKPYDQFIRFKDKPNIINFIYNHFDLSNISEYNNHIKLKLDKERFVG